MKKWGVCLLILAVLLLCAGCAHTPEETEPLPTYTYPEAYRDTETCYYTSVYRRIQEPYATGFVFQGNLMQTVAEGGRTYEFASAISLEERDRFVGDQEALCDFLEDKGISTKGLTFRVLFNYTNWTDSEEGIGYFGQASTGSWQQALTTLQVALGDYTNYGYLYALADLAAAELGWEQDEVSGASQLTGSLLNLVYPCFDEAYATPEEISACKAAAIEILAGLENPWSEDAFLEARENYAQSHSLDFQPTYITFAYYSPSCPLKLQTKYLEIFKDSTYGQDFYVTVGYVLEDYFVSPQKIMETFQWLDEQLAKLRSVFQVEKEALVSVRLWASSEGWATGTYGGDEGNSACLNTKSVHFIAPGYCRFLYAFRGGPEDPAYEQWMGEAAVDYYTVPSRFETYYLLATNADPARMEAFEKLLGEAFDEPVDFLNMSRKVFRKRENVQYEYELKSVFTLCDTFGEYFVRTYGEDAFLDCMVAPSTVEERTGKTMEEIVDDWCADMADPAKDALVQYVGPL